MDMPNFDLSTVYIREDGAYVVNGGAYVVHNVAYDNILYNHIKAYIEAHPEVVNDSTEKALDLVKTTATEYAKHIYPYTEDQYTVLVNGGMYSEFNEDTDYPDGWLVLYEGNLYRLTKVEATEETATLRASTMSSLTLGKYSLSLVWSKPTEE